MMTARTKSALMLVTQDDWGFYFDVEGVIFPGDLPAVPVRPTEEALAAD